MMRSGSRPHPLRWALLLGVLFILAACGGASDPDSTVAVETLPADVTVQQVAALADQPGVTVLDVREPWEYEEGHIPGVTLIPMGEVAARLDEIPRDQPVIVTCRSGNRSGQIATFLRDQGYDNIHNMTGGILAWEAAGLPVER